VSRSNIGETPQKQLFLRRGVKYIKILPPILRSAPQKVG
jgi:hypothetical protein